MGGGRRGRGLKGRERGGEGASGIYVWRDRFIPEKPEITEITEIPEIPEKPEIPEITAPKGTPPGSATPPTFPSSQRAA